MGTIGKLVPERQEYARSDVATLVTKLRGEILSCEPETRLGLEEELTKRYGASRPTLRQAMRVLEHENLISVRRGWSGGYYTRRPRDRDLVEAAALSLQMHHCTLPQAIFAGMEILRAVTKAAAHSTDQEARGKLRDYIKEYEAFDVDGGIVSDFIKAEVTMAQRISELARNPALTFFMNIIYEYGVRRIGLRSFDERPERMKAEIEITAKVARAICDGEVQVAEIFMARKQQMLLNWFNEDLASSSPTDKQLV